MSLALTRALGARLATVAAMPVGVALLALAVTTSATVTRLDALTSAAAHTHAAHPVVAVSLAVTLLGSTHIVFLLCALVAAALLASRLWHASLALIVAVSLTQPVVELIKHLVSRPRPPANATVAEAAGYSFPSGHSATAAAMFGVLALVALGHFHGRARTLVALGGVAVVAVVGLSRVLLGAHYPTDVAAGWLTGATIAALSWLALSRLRRVLG